MKQEKEKEQHLVTSTSTPAEDREEEEEKEKKKKKERTIYQIIPIRDNTSKVIDFKNYCCSSLTNYTGVKPFPLAVHLLLMRQCVVVNHHFSMLLYHLS
ncbi:MAG TPA: hypothetical protein VFQ47_09675 [Nitrososphaera sp.]|nr:hypothetical protein [Nitrososphaera sp.]